MSEHNVIQKWGFINRRQGPKAFTLIELLVVIAIIAILAAILLPVLAAAKARGLQAQCINNEKQLAVGWVLYATDSQDYMMPNDPYIVGSPPPENECWCPNKDFPDAAMGWSSIYPGNTNQSVFTNTIMAPYLGGQLGVYRCPADIWPSANGSRVRDYSMQGQVGNLYCKQTTLNNNPAGVPYVKISDLHTSPGPADTIVFLEEHPNSLLGNSVFDGYLEVDSSGGTCPDVPGSNHRYSNGISFADGHAEMHRWTVGGYVNYSTAGGITTLQIPVVQNASFTICQSPAIVQPGKSNRDWYWFVTHCSGLNPGYTY